MSNQATFFLSGGRIGSHWWWMYFLRLYREIHPHQEILGAAYKPNTYFRQYDNLQAQLDNEPEIATHLSFVNDIISSNTFTLFALVAIFATDSYALEDKFSVTFL